ncbi:DUF29 family protein [Azospirillum soli]|uniref:DUF29 family protein n=1 Tax=Azospirillum soli TaxID=1304799 RepID=UPI001AE4A094|nr:DUF29 family protein [Azospirillum soli]
MNRLNAAYDEDFHAWTQEQAAELRRAGAERCEHGWRLTIREQRRQLSKRLKQSPSLRPVTVQELARVYAEARADAADESELDLARFPTEPSFTLDQALDPAYPANLFPPEWRV